MAMEGKQSVVRCYFISRPSPLPFVASSPCPVVPRQRLQAGLAPWTLEGYIRQHQRWATGSLQILFQRCPLFLRAASPNFSLYQRISYWYAGEKIVMALYIASHDGPKAGFLQSATHCLISLESLGMLLPLSLSPISLHGRKTPHFLSVLLYLLHSTRK